jgi:hypothetical protein
MMSRIGRTTFQTRSLLAHQIPIGMPITAQNTIAVEISESVVIASFQTPSIAITTSDIALKAAMPGVAKRHASTVKPMTKTGNGMACSTVSFRLSSASTGHLMARKRGRRLSATQLTPCWIQLSIGKMARSSALNMAISS